MSWREEFETLAAALRDAVDKQDSEACDAARAALDAHMWAAGPPRAKAARSERRGPGSAERAFRWAGPESKGRVRQ